MLRVPTSRGNGHPQPIHRNLYSIDCTAVDGAWKATVQMQSYRAPCLLQTIRSNNHQLGLSPFPVKTHGYPERRGHGAVLSRRVGPTRQACGQVHQQSRRFRLPSLHILHVRCQFCVIRAVRRNLQFFCLFEYVCAKNQ